MKVSVLKSKKVIFKVSNGAGAGVGTVIPIHGSSEPESKEIL
jgi:hypothetical protein